ncbi:hypothetical protein [Aurantiacibacter gangjinensis]|uniref:Uncharacterized protein n=1 Tax=Aurantiacibacter gangjinensis TaxID=502682 RepID=A0A0G9MN28_9SPHN|nr:hypothetical protein [Aurantiacibacter gangjinensis]APE28124.1 hypothetical protein BMF35_a1295 [Aurantiacibacter gangjinensis]KLE32044.1 hypothetical protein AAW01_11505 [Aurantiacibacter gangjinensis]
MMRSLLSFLLLMLAVPAAMAQAQAIDLTAEPAPTPQDVIAAAIEAHGGEFFRDPGTLALSGQAHFFNSDSTVRVWSPDYRMWREFTRGRTVSHGADGKVRILAHDEAGGTIFEVGYDGETTWTQDGIMPRDLADAYWASNFGFGIIRSALDAGFTLSFAPGRYLQDGETVIVRIVDPRGQETLFGIDVDTAFITYMAFRSPRGWHERFYSDFRQLDNGWVQAQRVVLVYDGIVANQVFWEEVSVGETIDPGIFTPPAPEEAE